MKMPKIVLKVMAGWLIVPFVLTTSVPVSLAQSISTLPEPGTMVSFSQQFSPSIVSGLKVDKIDPFRFDFIVSGGDARLEGEALKAESERLIKFFLAALTTPEKDLWVNLSPYEKGRVIADDFGLTDMGRVLLEQDYVLKQIMATLLYPENGLGKEFWRRVYQKAQERYGTTDIPTDTFHKVWIVPETARVYENNETNTVVIVESRLRVMLEEDYVAIDSSKLTEATSGVRPEGEAREAAKMSSEILREVVLPELQREVNEGKNFAPLRQVYNSLILAAWYKDTLKESILNKGFSDRNKTAGVTSEDPAIKEKVYERYLEAYKKGVFNYIKEDTDLYSGEVIPRKYFSGGVDAARISDVLRRGRDGTLVEAAGKIGKAFVVSALLGAMGFLQPDISKANDEGLGVKISANKTQGQNELSSDQIEAKINDEVQDTSDLGRASERLVEVLRKIVAKVEVWKRGDGTLNSMAGPYVGSIESRADVLLYRLEHGQSWLLSDVYMLEGDLRYIENLGPEFRELRMSVEQVIRGMSGMFRWNAYKAERPTVVLIHGAKGNVLTNFGAMIDELETKDVNILFINANYFKAEYFSDMVGQSLSYISGLDGDVTAVAYSQGTRELLIAAMEGQFDVNKLKRVVFLGSFSEGSLQADMIEPGGIAEAAVKFFVPHVLPVIRYMGPKGPLQKRIERFLATQRGRDLEAKKVEIVVSPGTEKKWEKNSSEAYRRGLISKGGISVPVSHDDLPGSKEVILAVMKIAMEEGDQGRLNDFTASAQGRQIRALTKEDIEQSGAGERYRAGLLFKQVSSQDFSKLGLPGDQVMKLLIDDGYLDSNFSLKDGVKQNLKDRLKGTFKDYPSSTRDVIAGVLDSAQIADNSQVGGIDLEKTRVDVDKRKGGVVTAFDSATTLDELLTAPGLAVSILSINPLTPGISSEFLGKAPLDPASSGV